MPRRETRSSRSGDLSVARTVEILGPSTILAFLRDRGLLRADESPPMVRELAGGVSNVVMEVEGPTLYAIVKQSLPQLRVTEEWFANRDRILTEAAALELAASLTPGRVPRVVDVDPEWWAIAIEPAPRGWRPWKEQLLDGSASPAVARGLGSVLASWQCQTATDAAFHERFADTEVFGQLRIDPYYKTVAARHESLRPGIESLVTEMAGRSTCFVHGDFSPKNVLSDAERFWIIDFEVAHAGDPVFDVAFMLHHLLMKALHTGEPDRIAGLAREFVRAYRADTPGGVFGDPEYLAGHIGCLLLGRVDGKSPADYLSEAERETVRAQGARLVRGEPEALAELARFVGVAE
jgi:5-methylthioribose kinase